MAKKAVEVDVYLVNKLEIKVKPWAVHVDQGDTIEWTLTGHGVQSLRIDRSTPASTWPFKTKPPDPAYEGKHPKTPQGRDPGAKPGTIPYTITVSFSVGGKKRVATIDPDMVID